MTDPRPLARQVGLLIVTFVATLAILMGLLAVVGARKAPAVGSSSAPVGGSGAGGEAVLSTPSPASVTGSSSGEPTAATDPVLVGAGEIG